MTELSSKEYDYGTPAADIERPADPEKTDETGQYSYTFTGWDSEIEDVTGDATYTATYERTLNKYTVTFMNGLTELSSKEYDYGTPASDIERPADPEKTDETGQYSYTFKGWDREIKDVTGNATYTATYERTLNKYTVTFMDDDGLTELSSKEYDYGTPAMDIERPADPEKTDETGQYSYTFTGWDSDIEDVTGNATYTAVYDSTLNKYTVTFMNGLTELSSKEYDYGTPAMDIERPADPEKTDETGKYSYTFKGWDKEIEDVTGNATYTATYDETINKYTVTVAVPQDMIIYVSTDENNHEFTGPQSYTVNLSYGTEVSIGFEFVPGGTWTDFDYDYAEITVDGEPLDPGENSVVVTHNTTVTIEIETPLIIEG